MWLSPPYPVTLTEGKPRVSPRESVEAVPGNFMREGLTATVDLVIVATVWKREDLVFKFRKPRRIVREKHPIVRRQII
jgi:hypothetical protein